MDVTSAFDKRTNQGKCLCVLGSTNADLEHHESQELYLNLFLLIGLMRSLGHNQVICRCAPGV